MRHYLKKLIIVLISLYLALSVIPTINLGSDQKNLPIIIASFLLVSMVVRPIFSLVLLPLNFATVGGISFFLNAGVIFILLNTLPGAAIGAYNFPGLNIEGIILQPAVFNQTATVFLVALIITITQKILHIIFE